MRFMAVVLLVLAAGCMHRVERRLVPSDQAATLDGRSAYLKAHLKNGSVYLLFGWRADSGGRVISGTGQLFDVNRAPVASGAFRFPSDSVALFETNVLKKSGATTALTVMAGVTAVVAGICIINPKTCFGSCPTFYAPDSSGLEVMQAEGFSASIAPALEATDVDMLYASRPHEREFTIHVTNEALETHVIRRADLLALPRPSGGRVFATPGGAFLQATGFTAPSSCHAAEGDCRAALARFDGVQRSSLTDSVDLGARETIELTFDSLPAGRLGLVVASRQTLVTTYLLYQALAYLGQDAGTFLASLETGGPALRQRARAMNDALGKIDVLVPAGDEWVPAGTTGETGPIAVDTKVIPLPPEAGAQGSVRLRLRLTRGLWRIDYVALVVLGDSVEPIRIAPKVVQRAGATDADATRALRDSTGHRPLTTFPGDAYDIVYRLPEHSDRYELFLEARGYYLEWLRREWLPEADPARAARLAFDPAGMLRELAPQFKQVEPSLEHLFWSSRYVQH
ncbi:MAG TPA: hypothetical protein VL563_00915 [Gemmatimonadales bacterium]|nr:hypothetical protein [Gemmatimonadales bacterium]